MPCLDKAEAVTKVPYSVGWVALFRVIAGFDVQGGSHKAGSTYQTYLQIFGGYRFAGSTLLFKNRGAAGAVGVYPTA